MDFRLQATSKAFYANKWILCDKNVSLNSRIKFFDSVTSVVRFGAGQRKLYKSEFRKLMCTAVNFYVKSLGHQEALIGLNRGTPFCINGTNVSWKQLNGFKLWSQRCVIEYWKFVQYVAVLDDSRWLKRALVWNAGGGRLGRSFDLWETPVTKFCRWQNIGEWELAAQDKALWLQYTEDFVSFMQM